MGKKQENCVCNECEQVLETIEIAWLVCLCGEMWMLSGLILLCSLELLIVFSMYKGRLACTCTFWKDIFGLSKKIQFCWSHSCILELACLINTIHIYLQGLPATFPMVAMGCTQTMWPLAGTDPLSSSWGKLVSCSSQSLAPVGPDTVTSCQDRCILWWKTTPLINHAVHVFM